ncbi:hypothetical protein M404DRAFT_32130 [Pisolithus tinctorius Marx 270]|uniref:Uncharacterized protein n=1 Tax=Pisolithus tinctorius Marx 270 TaxID=870435 RepID=A0A0C3NQ04_PISTI|nr:hypothetical protein M404DRAFT_32130 [Pisolithus tinctorius Marx 270]
MSNQTTSNFYHNKMPTVLAFFLSNTGYSGQRLVCFRRLHSDIKILHQNFLFPGIPSPYESDIYINNIHSRIIFDRFNHLYNRTHASYLFVRLGNGSQPINIWPENDTDALLEALLLYLTVSSPPPSTSNNLPD